MVEGRRVSRVLGSNSLDPRRKIGLAVRLLALRKKRLDFIPVLFNLTLVFHDTLESLRWAVVWEDEAGKETDKSGDADGSVVNRPALALRLNVLTQVKEQWGRTSEQSPSKIIRAAEVANNSAEVRVDINQLKKISVLASKSGFRTTESVQDQI